MADVTHWLTITTGVGDRLHGEYTDALVTKPVTMYLTAVVTKTAMSISVPLWDKWNIVETSVQEGGRNLVVRGLDEGALRQAIDDDELEGAVLNRGEEGRFLETEGETLVVSATGAAVLDWLEKHPSALGVGEPAVFTRTSPLAAVRTDTGGRLVSAPAVNTDDALPQQAKMLVLVLTLGLVTGAIAMAWRQLRGVS